MPESKSPGLPRVIWIGIREPDSCEAEELGLPWCNWPGEPVPSSPPILRLCPECRARLGIAPAVEDPDVHE